jgi:hypothetical protein
LTASEREKLKMRRQIRSQNQIKKVITTWYGGDNNYFIKVKRKIVILDSWL